MAHAINTITEAEPWAGPYLALRPGWAYLQTDDPRVPPAPWWAILSPAQAAATPVLDHYDFCQSSYWSGDTNSSGACLDLGTQNTNRFWAVAKRRQSRYLELGDGPSNATEQRFIGRGRSSSKGVKGLYTENAAWRPAICFIPPYSWRQRQGFRRTNLLVWTRDQTVRLVYTVTKPNTRNGVYDSPHQHIGRGTNR